MSEYILIQNASRDQVKRACQQWMNSYADSLEKAFEILVHSKEWEHVIEFNQQLDPTLFFFLVNYLKYPEGIRYQANVMGQLRTSVNGLDEQLWKVYISESDTEYYTWAHM